MSAGGCEGKVQGVYICPRLAAFAVRRAGEDWARGACGLHVAQLIEVPGATYKVVRIEQQGN